MLRFTRYFRLSLLNIEADEGSLVAILPTSPALSGANKLLSAGHSIAKRLFVPINRQLII